MHVKEDQVVVSAAQVLAGLFAVGGMVHADAEHAALNGVAAEYLRVFGIVFDQQHAQ
ncbi:MAG: hypothetical protein R6V05_08825 [Candidatus Brocadiia bacterium]